MEFLKIFSIIVTAITGIVKLYFFYKKELELFKRFFNNLFVDRLLVILTGGFSVLFIVYGLMIIVSSKRPFDFFEYGTAIFFLILVSGVFFITSCNLWQGTIIPNVKVVESEIEN